MYVYRFICVNIRSTYPSKFGNGYSKFKSLR